MSWRLSLLLLPGTWPSWCMLLWPWARGPGSLDHAAGAVAGSDLPAVSHAFTSTSSHPGALYQAVLGMGLPAWPQVTPSRGLTVPVTQGGDRVTKGNSGACWESPFTRLCAFGAPTLCPVIFGGSKEGGNQPYPGEFILWWRWRAGHRGATGASLGCSPHQASCRQLACASLAQGAHWLYLWDSVWGRGWAG